jgi:predicted transcriptional regulator
MTKITTDQYNTSLRLPKEWHAFMEQFAEKWNAPTSYIYRQAIIEFIAKHQKQVSA